jgi:hypothetical protein
MPQQGITSFLKRIPITHGLLSAAVAAVSPTLIRSFLIPDQLSIIAGVGSLFVFIGFILYWAYREAITKRLRLCIVISLCALTLLILFQIFLVKTLENYGEPASTHRFLVGFNMNEEGRSSLAIIGSSSTEELIRAEGWQRIPTWYGIDYYIIQSLYALSYIVLILGVVLALGVVSAPNTETARRRKRIQKE